MSSTETRWAQRIVGQGEVNPAELTVNPRNWRQHPLHQRQALRELLERVGWVQQVVVNRTTGHLVDGHLRVELAREDGAARVPVLYVELDDEEEQLVLATLDPVAALAAPDIDQLHDLVEQLPDLGDGDLRGMLDDLIGQFTAPQPERDDGEDATERDFWPTIKLQVSYDTFRAFESWWDARDGDDDESKVRELIGV
jgi:hypothetical protein